MPRADCGELSRAVHGVKLFVCRSPSILSKPRPVGGVSNGLTRFGTPQEIYGSPVNEFAADFIGAAPPSTSISP